jgi:hypothetical protein
MSEINIKTEKDLRTFLKIVSEQAYKKSLRETNDPFVSQYNSSYQKDEDRYGSLDEVEEEDEEEQLLGAESDTEQSDETEEPLEAETPVEKDAVRAVSFDSIKKAIKVLRSGKSVDSDVVDDSLNVYYDRLDDNERLVLYTFLSELSKIMNLSIEGDDAQDPGDPPVNIDFVSGEEEADQKASADADALEEEEPVEAETDEEDTAPPIEVNENQDKAKLIEKIRYLMAK